MDKIQALKEEIIHFGREAWLKGFVAATAGNISIRVDEDRFLITAHNTRLGNLGEEDILVLKLTENSTEGMGKSSTETSVHFAAYKQLDAHAVIHLHPPYVGSLAALGVTIRPMTFETSLFLGTVPVIAQETPTVGHLDEVIAALNLNKVVILKNHGTIAIGDDLKEALSLTEMLEEAALMSFIRKSLGFSDEKSAAKKVPVKVSKYQIFSQQHIQRITQLINEDTDAQQLGRETGLTTRWAVHVIEDNIFYNFHFVEGRIATVDTSENYDFLLSGKREHWVAVFNGIIDPFVGTTQGRLKLKQGDLRDLSKWYPPFYRIFELWKLAPVE